MSTVSGWCGQHGKPAHQWCRSEVCSCACHLENPQVRGGLVGVSAASIWDNKDAPARCVNTTARADRSPSPSKESG